MEVKFFNSIVDDCLKDVKETLVTKAKEYAMDDDRLYNLREGEEISGLTKESFAWTLMSKQLVSVRAHCHGVKRLDQELLREKLRDIRCYSIIIESLLAEELKENENE